MQIATLTQRQLGAVPPEGCLCGLCPWRTRPELISAATARTWPVPSDREDMPLQPHYSETYDEGSDHS